MAFRFALEPIFRLRQSLEEREKALLRALFSYRRVLLNELERSREKAAQQQTRLQSELLLGAVTAAEIQFVVAQRRRLEIFQNSLQQKLQEVQRAIEAQIVAYQTQSRQRELLQSVRENQLQQYCLEQQRGEMKELDEAYRQRHAWERDPDLPTPGNPCPEDPSPSTRPRIAIDKTL